MTLQLTAEKTQHAPPRRALSNILIGTLLSLLLLLPIAAHFLVGLGFSPVLSQSMQPSISAGDLVITRPVAVRDLAVGDVVVLKGFQTDARFSHRVVKLERGPLRVTVTTQGDANPLADRNPAVLSPNVEVPIVAAAVPYIGFGVVYLSSPNARLLGIVLLATSAALFLLRFAYRTAAHHNRKQATQ